MKQRIQTYLETKREIAALTEKKKKQEESIIKAMKENDIKTFDNTDSLITLTETPIYEEGFTKADTALIAKIKKELSETKKQATDKVKAKNIDLPVRHSLTVRSK